MNARVPWNARPREKFEGDRGAWNAAMGLTSAPVLWDGTSGEPIPERTPRGSWWARLKRWYAEGGPARPKEQR